MTTSPRVHIDNLRARARALGESGRWDEADVIFREILQRSPDDVEALNVIGARATARGEFQDAEIILRRALAAAPEDVSVCKNLGILLLQRGDASGATTVLQKAVANDPDYFLARLFLALALERDRSAEAAKSEYLAALTRANDHGFWLDPQSTPPALRPLVAHARRVATMHLRETIDRVLTPLRERYGSAALARAERCFSNFVGDDRSKPGSRDQRPLFLYFPGLPETPYLDRTLFPWYEALEDTWTSICDEMQRALEEDTGVVPFLDTPPLEKDSRYLAASGDAAARWDGIFFHRHGKRYSANCDRCPTTESALSMAPLVHIRDHSPEALFSVLGPGSHILPHTGVTNTRIVTHLPLMVPRDSALRVAGETHTWQPGRCISFDDTFEHEAWNKSNQTRVILLFDVWNPYLNEVEREAVSEFVATIGGYGDSAVH